MDTNFTVTTLCQFDHGSEIFNIFFQIYHDYLFEAIKNLKEKQPDLKENWITLIRWNDIEDNGTKKLQIIARKYYNESSSLKKRIDEIGMEILTIRRPNSKNNETRLPYLVDFILEELPSLMIGLNYKGEQFQTLGYPTKGQIISECPYEKIVCPKRATKNFPRFLSWPLRRGQIKNFIKPIMLINA